MHFHESFWVVAGTAAPVIALAGIVTYGQALGLQSEIENAPKPSGFLAAGLTFLVMVSQGFVLYKSLSSLASERNNLPVTLVIWTEIVALYALVMATAVVAITSSRFPHRKRP